MLLTAEPSSQPPITYLFSSYRKWNVGSHACSPVLYTPRYVVPWCFWFCSWQGFEQPRVTSNFLGSLRWPWTGPSAPASWVLGLQAGITTPSLLVLFMYQIFNPFIHFSFIHFFQAIGARVAWSTRNFYPISGGADSLLQWTPMSTARSISSIRVLDQTTRWNNSATSGSSLPTPQHVGPSFLSGFSFRAFLFLPGPDKSPFAPCYITFHKTLQLLSPPRTIFLWQPGQFPCMPNITLSPPPVNYNFPG